MLARKFTLPKLLVLLLVGLAAGWLVWKVVPPYQLGYHSSEVEAQTIGADGPRVGNCRIFPADNVWNTPIDQLKKDAHSEAYVQSIGPMVRVHPDFGGDPSNGIPFSEVPTGTDGVPVAFDYAEESDPGSYPIPSKVPIEGGGQGDAHVILIDQHGCMLYELWAAQPQSDGSWKAGSGIKMRLTSNVLRPAGKTSSDAAGLPIFPGLVRYDEVASGEIRHALRFTIRRTQAAYLWPARHKASSSKDVSLPPMGARFRLRADFDISRYSKTNQVIMTALKRYGMILADNGGSVFISGVPDKRWDDSDLHKLGGILAEDFEAVDESSLQMQPDSAAVNPAAQVR